MGRKAISPLWRIAIETEIEAKKGGALAAIWHSHWQQAGYEYRETHKARDEKIFVVRGNWAIEKGLMQLAGRKFTDEVSSRLAFAFTLAIFLTVNFIGHLPP